MARPTPTWSSSPEPGNPGPRHVGCRNRSRRNERRCGRRRDTSPGRQPCAYLPRQHGLPTGAPNPSPASRSSAAGRSAMTAPSGAAFTWPELSCETYAATRATPWVPTPWRSASTRDRVMIPASSLVMPTRRKTSVTKRDRSWTSRATLFTNLSVLAHRFDAQKGRRCTCTTSATERRETTVTLGRQTSPGAVRPAGRPAVRPTSPGTRGRPARAMGIPLDPAGQRPTDVTVVAVRYR